MRSVLGNPVWRWLVAAGLAILTYVVILILKGPVAGRLQKVARKTKTHFDELIFGIVRKTTPLFVVVFAVCVGSLVLTLDPEVAKALRSIAIVVLLIQAALWAHKLATALITEAVTKRKDADPASASAFGVIGFFVRLVLWTVVLLVALQNLGVKITALIAGISVGAVALALASQRILEDVFNSVAILLDKPFEVGDFIIVGEYLGTVERIGIKTTRVRSLTGEELVFANAELVGSRIKNYRRMEERRILFTVGVTYQTPLEKLKAIPGMVREIVELVGERVRFDRTHFKDYGAYSLNFEIVYYVLSRDYNIYMDIQQQINLAVYERFEKEGVEFAYPTQTLYVAREDASAGK